MSLQKINRFNGLILLTSYCNFYAIAIGLFTFNDFLIKKSFTIKLTHTLISIFVLLFKFIFVFLTQKHEKS